MRLALFGSPAFALPVLEALDTHHELVLVVTQPDKAAGRGLKFRSPAVAKRAKELGLRLEQPAKLKNNQNFFDLAAELELDAAITAAYGKILPERLLKTPKHGFLNVHASLLPKYRGAAPIQWALINGEAQTGISIMQTEAGLDTGPVRLQQKLDIETSDNSLTLFDKLAELGAETLLEALKLLHNDQLPCLPQDDSQASYAPMLSKEDGRIRWQDSADAIYNRFRGVIAWPGTWTTYHDKLLKIIDLEPASGPGGSAGEILTTEETGLRIAAGKDSVLLKTVQPAGKAKMAARDWANGYQVKKGQRLV